MAAPLRRPISSLARIRSCCGASATERLSAERAEGARRAPRPRAVSASVADARSRRRGGAAGTSVMAGSARERSGCGEVVVDGGAVEGELRTGGWKASWSAPRLATRRGRARSSRAAARRGGGAGLRRRGPEGLVPVDAVLAIAAGGREEERRLGGEVQRGRRGARVRRRAAAARSRPRRRSGPRSRRRRPRTRRLGAASAIQREHRGALRPAPRRAAASR